MKNDLFTNRKHVIIIFMAICLIIVVVKLFFMQVINKTYRATAKSNTVKDLVVYPARGEIFDRNGKLMVCNEVVYDLLVTPKYINDKFDVEGFCKLINLDTTTFKDKLEKFRAYSIYKSSVLVSQISKEDISFIQESLYKYDGIGLISRTVRKYPYCNGALFLGDVGETDADFLSKHKDYKLGDYRGIRGLENTYEDALKGVKGVRMIIVNSSNVEMGRYNDGEDDIEAVQGNNLILEIDNDLQVYGELLMKNKKGSIVAIDPKTGGILAMVSSPTFDPNMLVGRDRSKNYLSLLRDTSQRPLLNRAVMGEYPPGSTFKTFNALVCLQEKIINENTKHFCNGPLSSPIRCTHIHESPLSVIPALRESCNPFFWKVFEDLISKSKSPQDGMVKWCDYAHRFGLGQRFNTDIFSERSGLIPDTAFYNHIYGVNRWKSSTIRSLSIGQGEILLTPIQLANLAAAIGNKGFYIKPHFVRAIVNQTKQDTIYPFKEEVVNTGIDKHYFDVVTNGMSEVVTRGTARLYGQVEGVTICGKTGTAQNAGKNHAIFMAFAPMESPQIAIAVIVENAGYGSTYAVPVGSLLIEKYLNDTIARKWVEDIVLETKLINQNNE